jgi:putative membrane protein
MAGEADEPLADPRVDLAAVRTQLAWDRTLLAWIRTTLALMGAGAVLDKGVQLLHQAKVLAGVEVVRNGHLLGLTLTGVSTILFVVVCWQYVQNMRTLARISHGKTSGTRPALLVSVLVIFLGCAVFIVLLLDKS